MNTFKYWRTGIEVGSPTALARRAKSPVRRGNHRTPASITSSWPPCTSRPAPIPSEVDPEQVNWVKMEGFLEYYFSDGVWGRWPDLEQRGLYALLLRVDRSRTPMDGRRSSSAARLWVAQMFQARLVLTASEVRTSPGCSQSPTGPVASGVRPGGPTTAIPCAERVRCPHCLPHRPRRRTLPHFEI